MIEYRALEHLDQLEAAFTLEVAVWGLNPRDAVPVSMLRAIQHAGGSLLGAYDGEQLIGVSLAFPARVDSRWILWSHLTGVARTHQGQGIGFALKLHQRTWALDNGFDEIRWTFDPLQSGNANFNLRHLGATAERYYINFYGLMVDEINHAHVPSDRVEAVWRLRDPNVESRTDNTPPGEPIAAIPALLSDRKLPQIAITDPTQPAYRVEIPRRLPQHESLLAWRLALRQVLSIAFERNYIAVDFAPESGYLLKRR